MRYLAIIVCLAFGSASCTDAEPTASEPGQVLVPNGIIEKIVDGDTIDVVSDGETTRIRMIGFDTPESVSLDS